MRLAQRIGILVLILFLAACSTVPMTGRSQLSMIPRGQLLSMSYQQYDQFLKEHNVVRGTPAANSVQQVGARIQRAVETWMRQNGYADQLSGFDWEFNLVSDESVNAFAMPGGKVVVFEGLIPVARKTTSLDTGLAVVIGHEIAHVVAAHGNERMSQGLLAQLGGVALSVAVKDKPEQTQALWMAAYGAGAQVGILLPYSRLQEREADRLGLIFMAIAGYDPREALDFWKYMSEQKGGGAPPEFLSTHPSDQTRIDTLRRLIPEAMRYYEG
ncbi:MAG: M48 family metallopeptidase [Desulfatibacillaceae bacterium]